MILQLTQPLSASQSPPWQLLQYPQCGDCGETLHRPFICLECAFIGCNSRHFLSGASSDAKRRSHILDHLRDSGHGLAFDLQNATLLCAPCEDFVLDKTFEDVFEKEKLRATSGKKASNTEERRDAGASLWLIY